MMRFNPDTGQMEDDGQFDPTAIAAPTLNAAPTDTGGGSVTPAPMAPSIAVIAPPEESHKVERTGPQTTQTTAGPESTGALDDMKAAQIAGADARAAQQGPALQAAKIEATGADIQDTQNQLDQLRRQQAIEEHQRKVAALTAEKERRRQAEEQAAHPTTYWEDKSVPGKILASLLVGLGGFASSIQGGPNRALEIFQNAEAEDRQRKVDAYTRSKEFRQLAEKDVTAAHQALADKLAEITEQGITRANVLKGTVAAMVKRAGIPAMQAKADELNAGIDADNAEKRAKLAQHWDATVQSGRETVSDTVNTNKGSATGPPDLTALDANGKPYGKWRTMPEAEKGRDAQTALVGFRGAIGELNDHLIKNGKLYNPGSTEYAERQALVQNASRFLQKLNDAGVLNPGEYERNAKQLAGGLFQPAANAARANDLMIGSAERTYAASLKGKAVAGQDGAPAPAAAPAQAPAATPAPAKRKNIETVERNGKRYYRKGGDWYEL